MGASNVPLPDPNLLIFPRDPSAGALGDFAKQSRTAEARALEALDSFGFGKFVHSCRIPFLSLGTLRKLCRVLAIIILPQ